MCEWMLTMLRINIQPRIRCWRLAQCVLLCAVAAGGCGPKGTQFEVVDYRTGSGTAGYRESFDECYYGIDAAGHFDFVARRISIGKRDHDERITQVVHLHGIWHAVPGQTYAEDTMINATVSYLIVSGAGGASFEGGGFVSFRENRKRTVATGKLELAKLGPVRRVGDGRQLFERAELQGKFKAERNRRQVTRILTEMRHLFGPMPLYKLPPSNADVL